MKTINSTFTFRVPSCAYLYAFICYFLFASSAHAHALNENYVWVNAETDHISGRFEVNANDVLTYLDIDIDSINSERDAAVVEIAPAIQQYFESNFAIEDSGEKLDIQWLQSSVFEEDKDFLQFWFKTAALPDNNELTIKNTLFLDKQHPNFDKLHRSVLVTEYNKRIAKEFGSENSVLVFNASKTEQILDIENPTTVLVWKDFLYQGILHIIYGLDHVLFLVVLLLTTVLTVERGRWQPLNSFKPAFINTLKIVTLFTIAHSITLSLAALDLVNVNVALIESVIALSIIAVALNNIFPRYSTHAWALIFVFGLFHGLGFASAMGDLQFRTVLIERILIMFNVGVEVGQLAIVIVVFPLLYLMRKSPYYQKLIVWPLSIVSIILSTYWLLERTGVIQG